MSKLDSPGSGGISMASKVVSTDNGRYLLCAGPRELLYEKDISVEAHLPRKINESLARKEWDALLGSRIESSLVVRKHFYS